MSDVVVSEKVFEVFQPKVIEVTLPVCKKVAVISARELTGRDREQADIARMQHGNSAFVWFHAMISRVVSVGGKQLVPEDFSDMSTRDIDAIVGALRVAKDERFFPSSGDDETEPPSTFPIN